MSTVYVAGHNDAAAGSTTLTVTISTATGAGDVLAVIGQNSTADITSIVDSTGGNVYTKKVDNTGSAFFASGWVGTGTLQLGAAYSGSSYGDVNTDLGAAQELDTWLNGGNWPTHKLTPRTMGFNVARKYYGGSAGGDGVWPIDAAHDTQDIAGLAANGVGNVCVTFRPARDGTNAYTGSTFTTEYNNLVSSIAYILSVFPNAKFTLWHEANIFGQHGPFGDGSLYKGGSPYGSSVSITQTHTNWQAYVNKYGPAFHAAGAQLYWMGSMASAPQAIDFFDVALNSTQQSWYTGIGSDYYCSDAVQDVGGSPAIKTGFNGTYQYGTNNLSMAGMAHKYGLPLSIWEIGDHGGSVSTSDADMIYFLNYVQSVFTAELAGGHPCGEILLFNYGTNSISGSTSASVITAWQQLYDACNGTSTALGVGSTVTLTYGSTFNTKDAGVIGIPAALAASQAVDQASGNSGSSASPSFTSGTLADPQEVAIAFCVSNHAAGPITWGAGWTSLFSEVNGSGPHLDVAYQITSGTGAINALGTLGISGTWSMSLLTFPVSFTDTAAGGGAQMHGLGMSGAGSVAAAGVTGSGGLSMKGPALKGAGISEPGTPYLIGEASTSGTSLSIPVTNSVNDGDSIQVGVNGAASSTFTVGPDTAGNVYTLVAHFVGTAEDLYVYECDGANPLAQGVDSIPVTQSVSAAITAAAIGVNAVTGLDKAVITGGTSTSPASPSTGTLGSVEEIAIGWAVQAGTGGATFSWAAPWSSNALFTNTGSTFSVAYQKVTANTAITASGTISASEEWVCACTTLFVTPISIATTPTNGILGIPYSQTLEYSGGDPPDSVAISAGSLPPGLALSGSVISGVPTAAGSYSFTITATDSLGVSASLPVTVEILSGATGAPPFSALSNNLLSPQDADFETDLAFTWAAYGNATAPQTTSAVALTGDDCLYWKSIADGPTSIASTPIPVQPGLPYIFSGAILLCAANACQLQIEWDDQFGNLIRVDSAFAFTPSAGTWAPLHGAFTAPAGAATGQPIVSVNSSNAGDINAIDMMFLTQDDTQVLVDWINPPFLTGGTAGNSFMDVSPWVRMDTTGVTYTTGRQDALSEIQGASGSFELQGDQGEFTPENSTALPVVMGGAVTLQRRVRFKMADENGVWSTRFDGAISEIDPTYENTGNTASFNVMVTDVLSLLQRQDPLFCWTKQQVLNDGPLYHWTLNDPGTVGGSGVAAETSGNNGPPMRLLNSDSTAPGGTGAATIAWEDTSGGVETLADAASATGSDGSSFWVAGSNQPTSLLRGLVSGNVGPFTTPLGSILLTPFNLSSSPWPTGTQTAQNTFVGTTGYMLTTQLPAPIAPTATGNDYSVEMWMMPDPSIGSNLSAKYGPFIAFGLGSSSTKTNLLAGIFLNSGTATFECATYSQPPSFLGLNWPGAATPTATASTSTAFTPDKVKRPHHVVVTISGDPSAATVTLWLDGTNVGNFALPKGQTYDTVCIGGAYGGCGAFFGNLSIASIYPYVLSVQQITQHCQFGQYGMWENTTDDCIAQLGQLANLPSFWSNLGAGHVGLTMSEYLDITNSNAISAMQQYEQAEGGLLFVNSQGALTFHTRSWRMGARGPDLYLPQNVFDADLQYRLIDQFQCNEEGVSGPNTLGANATTLLANVAGTAVGSTTTQTTTSTVIQAGYVNTASQEEFGVYATNPVSSPLTLPLITWSRAYSALGLPSYSYWADPALSDRAAWDANARSDPWFLPTSVTIDLLTLDIPAAINPPTPYPVGISSFYALGIDSLIAPSPNTLPPSFPNAQTSVEWFIEGYTETKTMNSHTIEFYTSPAEPQRAWIPGDSTYGVLGSTTRIGISTADLSAVQADGKSVSHDAGPPYWAPTFSGTMNAPDGNTKGFVGAADIRGIAANLQALLKPTMCVVTATSETQSFTNGALTGTSPPNIATLYWDVIHVDTAGGMSAVPGWPNWYLVNDPGFYEIDGNVTWSLTGSGLNGYCGQAWIVVAKAAAQAIAAGTGTPLTVDQYVCPVGDASRFNNASMTPVNAPTTVMYLGLGDMVCIAAEHNYTSSRGTSTAGAGSAMSLRKLGNGKMDDRTLINTSIGSGGTVSLVSHGALQQATFQNTHTYSYQGDGGFTKNGRRNSDLGCYQGLIGASDEGSQCAQIVFSAASIMSTLTGHTVLSATLTGTNVNAFYSTGAKLMLGTTKDTPGTSKFDPDDSQSTPDVVHQLFASGSALTFSIPVSLVTAFVTGGAQALCMGDGNTSDLEYAGEWQGGPDSWTLTVNYV